PFWLKPFWLKPFWLKAPPLPGRRRAGAVRAGCPPERMSSVTELAHDRKGAELSIWVPGGWAALVVPIAALSIYGAPAGLGAIGAHSRAPAPAPGDVQRRGPDPRDPPADRAVRASEGADDEQLASTFTDETPFAPHEENGVPFALHEENGVETAGTRPPRGHDFASGSPGGPSSPTGAGSTARKHRGPPGCAGCCPDSQSRGRGGDASGGEGDCSAPPGSTAGPPHCGASAAGATPPSTPPSRGRACAHAAPAAQTDRICEVDSPPVSFPTIAPFPEPPTVLASSIRMGTKLCPKPRVEWNDVVDDDADHDEQAAPTGQDVGDGAHDEAPTRVEPAAQWPPAAPHAGALAAEPQTDAEEEDDFSPISRGELRRCVAESIRTKLPIIAAKGDDVDAHMMEVTLKADHSLAWLARFSWRRCQSGKAPKGTVMRCSCKDAAGDTQTLQAGEQPLLAALQAFSDSDAIIFMIGPGPELDALTHSV
ncbi:unnamed protein product, partial [Prorocentrum cordatum]